MDDTLVELLGKRRVDVLATIKRDGRPQLSNVSFTYVEATKRIRVSTTDRRAKTANMRRDPRVSFHVSSKDGWSYVVAEGTAGLSPVASEPHDTTVEELIEIYRTISGREHPDWDDYRAAMVRDRRLVLTIAVDRVYGLRRDS